MIHSILKKYPIKITTLSPVHIGSGADKSLIRGIDYVVKDKKVFILHGTQMLREAKEMGLINTISAKLAQGDKTGLEQIVLKNLFKPELVRREYTQIGEPKEEIKIQMADGFGKPFIPGSSLKGAVRSILLKELLKGKTNFQSEKDIFGHFKDSIMRFIQIPDLYLGENNLRLYPLKIFSGDENRSGRVGNWKHSQFGGHSAEYRTIGFETYAEGFKSACEVDIHISLGLDRELPRKTHDEFSNLLGKKMNFLQSLSLPEVFSIIRKHTNDYLEKELEYYEEFYNEDVSEEIISKIKAFIKANNGSNSCVLRVGSGVGFHSITGDWQDVSQSHIDAWIEDGTVFYDGENPSITQTRSKRSNQIFAKTRKFAEGKTVKDNRILSPLGFIKLNYE